MDDNSAPYHAHIYYMPAKRERADALLMVECRGKASEAGLDFGLPPAAQAAMRNTTPTTVITASPSTGFTAPSTSPYVRRQY